MRSDSILHIPLVKGTHFKEYKRKTSPSPLSPPPLLPLSTRPNTSKETRTLVRHYYYTILILSVLILFLGAFAKFAKSTIKFRHVC
jgi:hypothetical protein